MILPCNSVTSRRTSGVHLGPSSCVSLGPSASCYGLLWMVDWLPSLLLASPPAEGRNNTVTSSVSDVYMYKLPSRCSASFMFATNYVKYFNECIRSSIFSLLCHLHQSENPLSVNYFHTDIHFRSSMYTYWRSLLHNIALYFTLFFII